MGFVFWWALLGQVPSLGFLPSVSSMEIQELVQLQQDVLSGQTVNGALFAEIVDEVRNPNLDLNRRHLLEKILSDAFQTTSYSVDSALARFWGEDYDAIVDPQSMIKQCLKTLSSNVIYFGLRIAERRGLLTKELLERALVQVEKARRGNLSAQLYYRVTASPLRRFTWIGDSWRKYGHIRDGTSMPGIFEFIFELALKTEGGREIILNAADSWDLEKLSEAFRVLPQLGEEGHAALRSYASFSLLKAKRNLAREALQARDEKNGLTEIARADP